MKARSFFKKPLKVANKTALISVLSLVWITGFAEESVEDRLQRMEQMADSRGQQQAELVFQLNAIQQELQQLRGQIEEHEYQLKQLQDRQRDLYRDIERRLAQLQNSAPPASNQSSGSTGSVTSSQTSGAASSSSDVHGDYQKIFPSVKAGKYDEAISQYTAFLRKYPNSQYEPNVYYWLGQIYFIRQELDKSAESFKVVSSKHPDSAKAPDALFKQGKILVIQEQWQAAKSLFETVVEKYDGTIEQLAKKELDSLKTAGHY